jgi:hypothetical protein
MPSLIAVLALAAGAFWLEAPGLIRRKHTKELVVFILFLLAGTAFYAALVLEVKLPNLFQYIKLVFRMNA